MPGKFDLVGRISFGPLANSVVASSFITARGTAGLVGNSPPLGHTYEVHINVPLCAGPARVALAELARTGRFKLSDMDGHEHGEKRETILTTHGRNYEETNTRTLAMCKVLLLAGYELIRYKIEHVLIDSRVDDIWGLIHAPR